MISSRDRKQKIVVDPRNTTWSDDAGGFGFRMLEKMGWSKGKGLGKHEDGSVQHLKQKMKQDLSGIGANDKDTSQNWLAHADAYASLLSNLKEINANEKGSDESDSDSGSASSGSSSSSDDNSSGSSSNEKKETVKEIIKEKEALEKAADELIAANPRYGRLYHRSKFQKGKDARAYDSAALNAILGISSAPPKPIATYESTDRTKDGWVKSRTVINEQKVQVVPSSDTEETEKDKDASKEEKREPKEASKKKKSKKRKLDDTLPSETVSITTVVTSSEKVKSPKKKKAKKSEPEAGDTAEPKAKKKKKLKPLGVPLTPAEVKSFAEKEKKFGTKETKTTAEASTKTAKTADEEKPKKKKKKTTTTTTKKKKKEADE